MLNLWVTNRCAKHILCFGTVDVFCGNNLILKFSKFIHTMFFKDLLESNWWLDQKNFQMFFKFLQSKRFSSAAQFKNSKFSLVGKTQIETYFVHFFVYIANLYILYTLSCTPFRVHSKFSLHT